MKPTLQERAEEAAKQIWYWDRKDGYIPALPLLERIILAALTSACEELEEDGKRLDWLERNPQKLLAEWDGALNGHYLFMHRVGKANWHWSDRQFDKIRDCIDEARKAGDEKCNAPVDNEATKLAASTSVQSTEQCSVGASTFKPNDAPSACEGKKVDGIKEAEADNVKAVLQKALSVIERSRSHVKATNDSEGLLDGFGPKMERPSDALLMELDATTIKLRLLLSENFNGAAPVNKIPVPACEEVKKEEGK